MGIDPLSHVGDGHFCRHLLSFPSSLVGSVAHRRILVRDELRCFSFVKEISHHHPHKSGNASEGFSTQVPISASGPPAQPEPITTLSDLAPLLTRIGDRQSLMRFPSKPNLLLGGHPRSVVTSTPASTWMAVAITRASGNLTFWP